MDVIENATAREFLIFLNNNVENIRPIHSSVFNSLFEALLAFFNFHHMELTITAFFAILPPIFLYNIIYRLSSGDRDVVYVRFVSFLEFFCPILLKFTNVRIWARFNFMGLHSIHVFFLNILRSGSFPLSIPSQFFFNILDRLPAFDRILADGNAKIDEVVRTARIAGNIRAYRDRINFGWNWFRCLFGTTLGFLFSYGVRILPLSYFLLKVFFGE